MSFKWNENSTIIFLNAYEKQPCLWNPHHAKYYNSLTKNEALKIIIKDLDIPNLTVTDCLEHIKIIKKRYGQEQLRIINALQHQKSYKPSFPWFSIIARMLAKVIHDEDKLQHINSIYKPYEECDLYQYYAANNKKTYNHTVPCPRFQKHFADCTRCSANLLTNCPFSQNTVYCINDQMAAKTITIPKPKFYTTKSKLLNAQLPLERSTKQVNNIMEHNNKKIPNSIGISNTNVTLPQSKHLIISHASNHSEIYSVQQCCKEVQNKILLPNVEKNIQTVEQCDKGIQNTICEQHINLNNYQSVQKYPKIMQKLEENSTNTVQCPGTNLERIIGVKYKDIKCSMPNLVLANDNGNHVPLKKTDLKYINKSEKNINNVCQIQKEEYSPVLDKKKVVKNRICIKEINFLDTIEIIKRNTIIIQTLVQCLENVIFLQQNIKIPSITSISSMKEDVKPKYNCYTIPEKTICETKSHKISNEKVNFATNSTIEMENTACFPCLGKIEKDNTVGILTKALFDIMKHTLIVESKKYIEDTREECIWKENTLDTLHLLNEIKECADKILEIHVVADFSRKQLSNKFCSKYKLNDKCSPQRNMEFRSIHNVDNPLKNHTVHVGTTTKKKMSVEDKEVVTCSEYHNIGLNVSLSQVPLQELGTQYSLDMKDASIETEHENNFHEKINIDTQTCYPMRLRVIECNNCETVFKMNKETCLSDVHVARPKYVKKCIETYPTLQNTYLTKDTYRKYMIRKRYNEGSLHPSVSHIQKKGDYIKYITPLLAKNNFKCDRECTNSLPYKRDQSKLNLSNPTLLSNQHFSRIPLYERTHKYARKNNNFYRTSRSYI